MGEVGISIDADGARQVAQRFDLRVFVRRLRPECFARHHVVNRPNSGGAPELVGEEKFLWWLKFFFVFTLSLTLFNFFIVENLRFPPYNVPKWDPMFDPRWLFWMAVLAVFAATLKVAEFANEKTNKGRSPPPKGQPVFSVVQHV